MQISLMQIPTMQKRPQMQMDIYLHDWHITLVMGTWHSLHTKDLKRPLNKQFYSLQLTFKASK